LAKLEAPGARQPKPIPEAIEAFHTSVGNLDAIARALSGIIRSGL
jgi:hypothetical protein